jgi:hypothetical protein
MHLLQIQDMTCLEYVQQSMISDPFITTATTYNISEPSRDEHLAFKSLNNCCASHLYRSSSLT